jgi:hypothetical protein
VCALPIGGEGGTPATQKHARAADIRMQRREKAMWLRRAADTVGGWGDGGGGGGPPPGAGGGGAGGGGGGGGGGGWGGWGADPPPPPILGILKNIRAQLICRFGS